MFRLTNLNQNFAVISRPDMKYLLSLRLATFESETVLSQRQRLILGALEITNRKFLFKKLHLTIKAILYFQVELKK